MRLGGGKVGIICGGEIRRETVVKQEIRFDVFNGMFFERCDIFFFHFGKIEILIGKVEF